MAKHVAAQRHTDTKGTEKGQKDRNKGDKVTAKLTLKSGVAQTAKIGGRPPRNILIFASTVERRGCFRF